MISSGDVELAAVRNAFHMLVARWRLNQAELGALLATSSLIHDQVLPGDLDAASETRMRLLLRLSCALERLWPNSHVAWLREADPADAGRTRLESLEDLATLRAAVAGAEEYSWDAGPNSAQAFWYDNAQRL